MCTGLHDRGSPSHKTPGIKLYTGVEDHHPEVNRNLLRLKGKQFMCLSSKVGNSWVVECRTIVEVLSFIATGFLIYSQQMMGGVCTVSKLAPA